MAAKIVGLTRYPQKGEPGVAMTEVSLLEGMGIEGDFHQGGERQVSLLSAGARRWMDAQTRKGLCFGKFRENILIAGGIGRAADGAVDREAGMDIDEPMAGATTGLTEGTPLEQLESGTLLSVGGAVLQISAVSKHCYDECDLFWNGVPCCLSGSCRFATVAKSGVVGVGDSVMIDAKR